MRRPEGEREMSGYLKQKLFQALHDLVGAGDLDQRLTHAGNYLAHVQDHEIPEEHREELGEIKAIMFATPLSPNEATALARFQGRTARSWPIESSSSTPRSWAGSKQAIRHL
jgi:hypothetical protein